MSAQVTPTPKGRRLVLPSQRVGNLLADATMRGKVDSLNTAVINYAEHCEEPVSLDLHGKRYIDHPSRKYAHGRGATLRVPCRRCSPCLRARSNRWAGRSINELRFWPRSWFGTMTLRPERQFVARLRAAQTVRRRRVEELEALSPSAQFPHLVAEISPEVTKWLKRVRKESGARLRYLLVSEAHKSGSPHFHILMHEVEGAVRKRTLEGQWDQGFSHWRLVDTSSDAPAYYVSKYLAKSALTRVRASAAYGQPAKALGPTSRSLTTAFRAKQEKKRERETPLKETEKRKELLPTLGESGGVDHIEKWSTISVGDPPGKVKGTFSSESELVTAVFAAFPAAQLLTEKEEMEWVLFR